MARARRYDEIIYAIVERYDDDSPQENESYDAWYKRVGHEYLTPIAECVYGFEKIQIGIPTVRVPDDVFLAEPGFRVPFATVSYSTQEIVFCDVSNSEAEQHITSLLRALSIEPHPARLLGDVAWWAYDEYPRLINPPD